VRDGKRLRTTNLDLRVVFATGAVSRIGFVVPKHGHSSVERNRLKRRLRELGRLQVLQVVRGVSSGPAIDLVMRAQPGAYRLEYDQLRSEVEVLRARLLNLLRDPPGEGRAGKVAEAPGA
jgi:ribonuclease P protein component